MHLSEDDIRTKVVYEWLKECGFSEGQISIEYSFSLQLPNYEKSIHSRSDVVVRSSDGRNLLIIEVKKPNHSLNDSDEIQAISYACLLKDGIAPFTVLTNGTETRLYDSVTRELIGGDYVPANHPYISSGFKPTGDGIKARMEALESLISLSEENLSEFCTNQVKHRMGRLKSQDLFSGKKYIPSLYVERNKPNHDLREKLFNTENPRSILLVVGPPQHGKTCFMCHTVEKLLADGYPVLFYPAITLDSGLIPAIKEDFDWTFSENMPDYQWIKRIDRIGRKLNKKIYIFIDGWNEMADHALKINQECQRLNLSNITIVLSTTSPSLPRLLNDEASNPLYIQEEIQLNAHLIERLKSEPLKDVSRLGIVQIKKFAEKEESKAREIYSEAFDIKNLPKGKIFHDPYYLRIACEMFAGNEIPSDITSGELIEKVLTNKGKRSSIDEISLENGLSDLAEAFFKFDRPLNATNLPKNLKSFDELNPWLESGILTFTKGKDSTIIDFYYTHELDYSISKTYKDWQNLFDASDDEQVIIELKNATNNQARISSLIWFLKCEENYSILKHIANALERKSFVDPVIDRVISDAIYTYATLYEITDFNWIEKWLKIIVENDEEYNRIEVAKLIYSLITSLDRKSQSDKYSYWMRLLVKYDNTDEVISIYESYITQVYGEDLKSFTGTEESTTLDVELFKNLILDEDEKIASRAAKFYAYACRDSFLKLFPQIKRQLSNEGRNYKNILREACKEIEHDLRETYYGTICKGWLIHAEKGDRQIYDEYFKMDAFLSPLIQIYPQLSFSTILEDLKEVGGVPEDIDEDLFINDPDQLSLNLE